MRRQKVFVTSDGKATFVCPACARSRTVDAARNPTLSRAARVRVKCPCGHQYPVSLERRRYFRKAVDLRGTFVQTVDGRHVDGGPMVVLDLSRTGMRIRLNESRPVRIGDTLVVKFQLDDRQQSLIHKESIVRRIDGVDLGTEFTASNVIDASTRAIGFYLTG
ncbi:MAG: PilZ domain-containing protein [Desulfobacterales bacterium]|nr:PilZ domain-containing protein [Desulfobacterales bacterium]